jgi:hypothetical protein
MEPTPPSPGESEWHSIAVDATYEEGRRIPILPRKKIIPETR